MQIPHADPGAVCPLHKVDCSKVCHKCPWWIRITGKNPQSEEMMDKWSCAISLLPILMVDNTAVNRGNVVAMETFRNGVVEAVGLAVDNANRRLASLDSQHRQLR